YDVPGDPEDYVHRIGRTARADETGLALTLITRETRRKFDRIEKLTGMKVKLLPLPPELESAPRPNNGAPSQMNGDERRYDRRNYRGGKNRNRQNPRPTV
ncbi:MAG: ATP-dependent helicase, partial [Bacteroidota bacterium]